MLITDKRQPANAQRFRDACEKILSAERAKTGIGTFGEKSLHAILKLYFEPDKTKHEITVGSFIADIVADGAVIEIQTRSFDKLRKKLIELLEIYPVTVVYPIPKTKWISWIDAQTGETTKKRKSPKQGKIYDAIFELYKIKSFLNHHNFRLCLVLLNMEEYRCLNGWSDDKKKGSTRYDRVPVDIVEEVYFCSVSDYQQLLPEGLQYEFTSKDYQKMSKTSLRTAQTALNILYNIGVVRRIGKRGNLHVYELAG